MNFDLVSFFGLGGSITAASLFFPQVWASHKSKKTKHLSWVGIFIGLINGVLWTSYGLLQEDPFIYVIPFVNEIAKRQ